MLRPTALLFLGLLAAAPVNGQSVEILATDPPDGQVLNAGEPLYVRLGYTSEQPLRFQARGYHYGTERSAGRRSNPAPVYPAGKGEALVWIEYTGIEILDELRIITYDASWVLVHQTVLPIEIEWQAGSRSQSRPRAAWVEPLSAIQQRMTHDALASAVGDDGDVWPLLIMLAGWSIPGYFILQIVLFRRWHGGWRKAALLPLWGTVPIVGYTLFALLQGSNLWPLVMLFTLPLAFIYLLALVIARRVLSPA
jgi:hypothetical protein